MDRKNARRILAILAGRYPDRRARERYAASPFEVLITTILSAQTTDKSVDAIRNDLFSRFPGPQSLATADAAEVGGDHSQHRVLSHEGQAHHRRFTDPRREVLPDRSPTPWRIS